MSLLIAELTATCNALGYALNGKNNYFLDVECKEAIRELIRFLRRDDETHEIRRHLGTAKILQTDLVPILIQHHADDEILDLLLRLLVNLTTPTLLLYNEDLPNDKVSRQYYLSIIKHLQDYKQAFANHKLWTIVSGQLSDLLKMDYVERGEEKSLIIVRILILVRNVLHIPVDTDVEKRADNDANTHDQVIWALYEEGIINLALYIAASENEKNYYFHVLEIISLMLRDQNAEELASVSVQRSLSENEQDEMELLAAREKETKDKQWKMKQLIAARHSRFCGTFVMRGVKSISDNDLVVHSLNKDITSSFDRCKSKLKTPKNRLPMQSNTVERRSAFSVRVLMKEFCIEFLNGAYNNLMHYIREMFHRGKAQNNDESYYFWAMRFFMEFNRFYKFQVKLISETMHVTIFHFTQERIEDWRAKLIVDKKKVALWSKRIHLGLKAYKELLSTLFKMYQSEDHAVKESAHTIMSNIFYIVEYREFLMSLFQQFDETKFSREYLKDLIESNHIFMKMLEHVCKRHRTLVVQKKGKVRRRHHKTAKKCKKQIALSLESSDEKWSELEPRITDFIVNRTELNVQSMPFDAASDIPFEDQKFEAMKRIKLYLLKSEVETAISLLRASREVWPENDCFGASYMPPEEEVTAVQEIFFADIELPAEAVNRCTAEENEDDDTTSENEEQEAENFTTSEQALKFTDLLKKFIRPKVIAACCLLLSQFEKNTTYTNHCIVKLLHRITFECKYSALLFQASVFRTFQRIFNSYDDKHKELRQFAVYIVRKFIDVSHRNKKVFMELLFWKSQKEAYEIEEGYGTMTVGTDRSGGKKKRRVKGVYSEDEDDEFPQIEGVERLEEVEEKREETRSDCDGEKERSEGKQEEKEERSENSENEEEITVGEMN